MAGRYCQGSLFVEAEENYCYKHLTKSGWHDKIWDFEYTVCDSLQTMIK